MKKNKTAKQIIAEARKSDQEGETSKAFELLVNFLFVARKKRTMEEGIEIVERAAEYLAKLRADASALIDKAEGLSDEGRYGSAIIEAQKSLEIFEKYGTKICVESAMGLIAKINKKMDEEMK